MSDIFLQKFYNDVRDPTWPDIENYFDYKNLPKHIKVECQLKHNYEKRVNEICNSNYWHQQITYGYRHKNLVFVPVFKCAHTYYENFFINSLGWEVVKLSDINADTDHLFGLVMHPLTRYLKGMTQWFWDVYANTDSLAQLESDLSKPHILNFIESTFLGDHHVVPYSVTFGKLLNQINWIPIDLMSDQDILKSMACFCEKYNYKIELPQEVTRINKSPPEKIALYNLIKSLYQKQKVHDNLKLHLLYYFYADDLKFYHNLIDNFDPYWQHL